jgi:phage gp36-like protein
MPDWLTESELKRRFGAQRIDRLADRDGDGRPDEDAISDAIDDAEAEVLGTLRRRYSADDLPDALSNDRVVACCADLAYWNLCKYHEVVAEAARTVRDEARGMLKRIASGLESLGLADAPSSDNGQVAVLSTAVRDEDSITPPMTLEALEDW